MSSKSILRSREYFVSGFSSGKRLPGSCRSGLMADEVDEPIAQDDNEFLESDERSKACGSSAEGRHDFTEHGDTSVGGNDQNLIEEETEATKKVLSALLSYRRFGRSCIRRRWNVFQKLPEEQQILLSPSFPQHIRQMRHCVEENYRLIKMIISHGVSIFGADCSMQEAVQAAQSSWDVSELYMSKVRSTLKQFVRDWSAEGVHEREACYDIVTAALCDRFPGNASRHEVQVLVPGAGLGRLAYEFVQQGFSVQGNEFSLFMLLASNFVFNQGLQTNEFTIYPYVLETCNNWSFEDQLRPVSFPDVPMICDVLERKNTFSMCAGDFLEVSRGDDSRWSAVVTVFFIDTAMNVIDYIDAIYRILKVGGIWINFGPLTYHFSDSDGALELPYDEILRLIKQKGFRFDRDERMDANLKSLYASNSRSMLHYQYQCGFFICTKV